MKPILLWVVDNIFHIFVLGLFNGIPLSFSGAIPYIAAASLTQLALTGVDRFSSYTPEIRGKKIIVFLAKVYLSFAIFPNVYQSIDAQLFKLTKTRALKGFDANLPNLENPECLDQTKKNFNNCNRLLSDFHWDSTYENPIINSFDCSKYDPKNFVEPLKNDLRWLTNFPKEGNFKECHKRFLSRSAGMFLVVSARLSMVKNVTQ